MRPRPGEEFTPAVAGDEQAGDQQAGEDMLRLQAQLQAALQRVAILEGQVASAPRTLETQRREALAWRDQWCAFWQAEEDACRHAVEDARRDAETYIVQLEDVRSELAAQQQAHALLQQQQLDQRQEFVNEVQLLQNRERAIQTERDRALDERCQLLHDYRHLDVASGRAVERAVEERHELLLALHHLQAAQREERAAWQSEREDLQRERELAMGELEVWVRTCRNLEAELEAQPPARGSPVRKRQSRPSVRFAEQTACISGIAPPAAAASDGRRLSFGAVAPDSQGRGGIGGQPEAADSLHEQMDLLTTDAEEEEEETEEDLSILYGYGCPPAAEEEEEEEEEETEEDLSIPYGYGCPPPPSDEGGGGAEGDGDGGAGAAEGGGVAGAAAGGGGTGTAEGGAAGAAEGGGGTRAVQPRAKGGTGTSLLTPWPHPLPRPHPLSPHPSQVILAVHGAADSETGMLVCM